MAVAKLTPIPDPAFSEDAFTRQQVMDKLTMWREHLAELDRSSCTLSRRDVMREVDRWLDTLNDVRGR